MINWIWQDAESQWFAAIEGFITNVLDGWRKKDCLYWFAVKESLSPNKSEIGRQLDESQGNTMMESSIFNPCDRVRYCNPHQGFTIKESVGSNGRMQVGVRDIWRGLFMIEAIISVDSRRAVGNDLRWQVSPQVESITPTCISTGINPRDCEGSSVDRESEFTISTISLYRQTSSRSRSAPLPFSAL